MTTLELFDSASGLANGFTVEVTREVGGLVRIGDYHLIAVQSTAHWYLIELVCAGAGPVVHRSDWVAAAQAMGLPERLWA